MSGCSAGESDAQEVTETSSPAPQTTTEPETTPTTEPAAPVEPVTSGPPAECLTATSTTTEGDPVAAAAQRATLPEGVSNAIGTQVISSTKREGMFEAVARICSEPLSLDELKAVATTIAQAIYADPANETVSLLKVSSWVPDGSGSIDQQQSVDTDYQMYLWDADPSLLPSNWTHNP